MTCKYSFFLFYINKNITQIYMYLTKQLWSRAACCIHGIYSILRSRNCGWHFLAGDWGYILTTCSCKRHIALCFPLKHLTEYRLVVQRLLESTFRLDIYAAREYELLTQNKLPFLLSPRKFFIRKKSCSVNKLIFSNFPIRWPVMTLRFNTHAYSTFIIPVGIVWQMTGCRKQ